MPVDYEVEYDNRARVPEHPQIFAEWARDAAAFRDETAQANCAELGIKYGPGARQTIDLFFPRQRDAAPLVMFVHGGWWRSLEPSSFSHMARGPRAHGVTVAVVGYELCPQVPIRDIIAQMQQACLTLWRRFGQRILVAGHSAGGHLTACLVATDWKAIAPDAPADLVSVGYSISGVFDLAPLVGIAVNEDLRLDADEAHRVSPLYWDVMPGHVLDCVVGAEESSEFLRQSKIMAEGWHQDEAETRYEEAPGNHFTVIAPLADPDSAMTERVVELAQRVNARPF